MKEKRNMCKVIKFIIGLHKMFYVVQHVECVLRGFFTIDLITLATSFAVFFGEIILNFE